MGLARAFGGRLERDRTAVGCPGDSTSRQFYHRNDASAAHAGLKRALTPKTRSIKLYLAATNGRAGYPQQAQCRLGQPEPPDEGGTRANRRLAPEQFRPARRGINRRHPRRISLTAAGVPPGSAISAITAAHQSNTLSVFPRADPASYFMSSTACSTTTASRRPAHSPAVPSAPTDFNPTKGMHNAVQQQIRLTRTS